jgi:hypothetical protein
VDIFGTVQIAPFEADHGQRGWEDVNVEIIVGGAERVIVPMFHG